MNYRLPYAYYTDKFDDLSGTEVIKRLILVYGFLSIIFHFGACALNSNINWSEIMNDINQANNSDEYISNEDDWILEARRTPNYQITSTRIVQKTQLDKRGQEILSEKGCFGCHEDGGRKSNYKNSRLF